MGGKRKKDLSSSHDNRSFDLADDSAHLSVESKAAELSFGPDLCYRADPLTSAEEPALITGMNIGIDAIGSVESGTVTSNVSAPLTFSEISTEKIGVVMSIGTSKQSTSTIARNPNKRTKKDPWAADHVVQNPKSPLVRTDIRAVLADPEAWEVLSPDERADLLALMPDNGSVVQNTNDNASIDNDFLRYDQDWSHSVTNYKEDLAQGRNDPEWQRQAITASQQRDAGAFDQFKEAEFEEYWGQKYNPVDTLAAERCKSKLGDLVNSKVVQVGDILRYSVDETRGVNIEKDAKIVAIRNSHADYSFAPDAQVTWTDRPDNIVMKAAVGPKELGTAIGGTLGMNVKCTNGWKRFRVFREGQDLGLLWDLRQAYGFARNEGDYVSALSGLANRQRRTPRNYIKCGYYWVRGVYLVKKMLISDLDIIPQYHVLPISDDLTRDLARLAPPNYTFILCDPRVIRKGGLCVPDGVSVDQVMERGPGAFPTAWTRAIASAYGPIWSGGHAHVGYEQLGSLPPRPNDVQHALTRLEQGYLEQLLKIDNTLNLPEAVVRTYNMRPPMVPNINARCKKVIPDTDMMLECQVNESAAQEHLSSRGHSQYTTTNSSDDYPTNVNFPQYTVNNPDNERVPEPAIEGYSFRDLVSCSAADEEYGSQDTNGHDPLLSVFDSISSEPSNTLERYKSTESTMIDKSNIENIDPHIVGMDSFYIESPYPDGLNYTIPRYMDGTLDDKLKASSEAFQYSMGIPQDCCSNPSPTHMFHSNSNISTSGFDFSNSLHRDDSVDGSAKLLSGTRL